MGVQLERKSPDLRYFLGSDYTQQFSLFELTICEAFLVTLMGSPLLVMGISDLSMMYRQASRTP